MAKSVACFGDTEFVAWRDRFASFLLDSGDHGRIIFAGGEDAMG